MDRTIAARLMTVLVLSAAIAACSYAPLQDIRVKPEFIKAGVQPGDTVEIETKDGKTRKFVVTSVSATVIEGEDNRVPLSDIQKIGVRSWQEPGHPCGAGEPVGCSVPEVLLVLVDYYEEQANRFHKACVTHDFCYRHGYATYGTERAACDDVFYQEMQDECGSFGALSVLDVKQYSLCQLTAKQTFEAVRRYGEPAYRSATSSYCEYR